MPMPSASVHAVERAPLCSLSQCLDDCHALVQLTNGQTVAKPPPVADTAAYQGINNVQVCITALML